LMSQLVRNDIGNAILVSGSRCLLIKQHSSGPIRDETPIFHGAVRLDLLAPPYLSGLKGIPYKFVTGEKVDLGQRIIDAENLGKSANAFTGSLA
jgi:hypothetical protein